MKRALEFGIVDSLEEFVELISSSTNVAQLLSVEHIEDFNYGFTEGAIFQNIAVAMNMIQYEVPIDSISKFTGLSCKTVNEIRELGFLMKQA